MPSQNYTVDNPQAEALIRELVDLCANSSSGDLLREILTTVVKLGMEHDNTGDYKLVNTTLKELRHAMRIFSPYRKTRKVCIFGSARTDPSDACYQMARQLSKNLVDKGFMVITGAGPGIMAAANQGAGKENSFGINIELPYEQGANPYIAGDPKLMTFKYFFTRKLMFIKESSATVLFPGGMGTQDEGFETLTLFQTGKCMPRPIVLVEPENGTYWQNWVDYLKTEMLGRGYISPEDLSLFHRVTSVEKALEHILEYYRVYHSLRYVRGQTVLRLIKEVSPKLLDRLNREFGDILSKGEFKSSGPLEDEVRNDEYPDLPRLVFNFDNRSFGRLNQMIRMINRSA